MLNKYKNIKTGAIIYSSCLLSGANWIKIGDPGEKAIEKTEEPKPEAVKVNELIDNANELIDGVTKKQIMQELDAMGISYNPKDRKEVLYNLVIGK